MASESNRVRPGRDALELLDEWFPPTPEDIELRERLYMEMVIAGLIYDARKKAGLTQRELARRVGTSAYQISRLERHQYKGNSFAMLRRVAKALGKRMELRLAD